MNFIKESFSDIFGYESIYQISNYGYVLSKNNNGIYSINGKMNGIINMYGYEVINLTKNKKNKQFRIHRLVALHFIPNPGLKHFVNHKDGNKLNNHVSNLEWVTGQENMDHAVKIGLITSKGENNNLSKLKNEDILLIRRLRKTKKLRELADMFNVTTATIGHICRYRTWKHIA